ncbi:MAG: hypothetical protein KF779_16340 [Hyphomonadaceae bacterium]|nr:hypothetical protein [Hyphomonadaceae bacterium]
MRALAILAAGAWLSFAAPLAWAEPIFSESFQDGDADGWAPSGGDVRLATYADNVSLRLTRNAAVVAALSTRGHRDVVVAAAMAAGDLEGDDYCLVEASGDGGQTWIEILRLRDGQDDGVTMRRNAVRDERFSGAERLLIGARVSGNGDNDQCWLDDVRVAGVRVEAAPSGPRSDLSAAWLHGAAPMESVAPMRAFAPPPDASAPEHVFVGALHVSSARGAMRVLRDTLSIARQRSLRLDTLPAFEIALAQDGDTLIPLRRGPMPSAHPNWEVAIEAGRVWAEATDEGWSRASLPFALIERNANCTHNGVLSFLFRDGEVSRVAWQIASETCAYLQFDAWGVAPARLEEASADAAAEAVQAYRVERAARMPVAPMSALATLGADIDAFASPADIDPAALTTFGVIYQGVHYRGGCDTRAGPYPYCESLLLPSYSLAKSLVGGFGLMRLELLYPGTMQERVAEHVRACRSWDGVTLENALDMSTGRYDSAASEADEAVLTSSRFFLSETLDEKLRIACGLYPRREAPGQRWVYHTPDTFVLGAAMADVWRAHAGAERDFFDDVLVQGVYAPLELSPVIRATRRTYDEARQPFVGWGLTFLADDIAKVADYLQHSGALPPLMSERALAAAMQRIPEDRGLAAADESLRYNNGFWAWNAQAYTDCADPVWTPFMSGFGGIVVALMPNGVTYYYVSDGGEYRWARAVRAAARIAPMCEGPR